MLYIIFMYIVVNMYIGLQRMYFFFYCLHISHMIKKNINSQVCAPFVWFWSARNRKGFKQIDFQELDWRRSKAI